MSEEEEVKSLREVLAMWIKEFETYRTRTDGLLSGYNDRTNELDDMQIKFMRESDSYRAAMASGQARQESRVGGLKLRMTGIEKIADRLVNAVWPPNEEEEPMYKSTRICKKYGVNEWGMVYNLQSGVEIPEDEPLFLFRAQDRYLPAILQEYARLCKDATHYSMVRHRLREVQRWQKEHDIKEPDTDISDYDAQTVPEPAEERKGQGLQFDPDAYARGLLKLGEEERKSDVLNLKQPTFSVEVRGPEMTDNLHDVVELKTNAHGQLAVVHSNGAEHLFAKGSWDKVLNRKRMQDDKE